jgi:tetratricopeptide (TPR) repeat protein
MIRLAVLALAAAAAGCPKPRPPLPPLPEGAEALSLLGEPLVAPALTPEELGEREAALAAARAELDQDPDSADAAIWVGRRLGYLNRFRAAVDVFTAAIKKHPTDARLYRHRGHRYITLRQLDRAIADLERAVQLRAGMRDEIEPDGMPNPAGIPTSTLHGNIWYHLGLAHYLRRDFAASERVFRKALGAATTDDSRVAAAYWLYLALRRLGRDADAVAVAAALPREPTILENHAYHALCRLFRAEVTADELTMVSDLDAATIGYGVAIWRLLHGDAGAGEALEAVRAGGPWPAFGAIAAEAELAAGTAGRAGKAGKPGTAPAP